ncbi:hypothetical protein HMPREF0294_0174 [Corynebacterium glucuronolyticum ATCC 51867]|nr:hypothetical protein HMPREF0294_0174 [Corynebacterium glucuronolyticum ATCC 51867]
MGVMVGTSVRNEEVFENGRLAQIAELRARMEAMGATVPGHAVIELLAGVPGLPRRAVTSMNECPALAVELIAQASGSGLFVAVVGWPELVLTSALEGHGAADNVLIIPDPGPDPLHVVGLLAEHMDLVMYHTAAVTVSPTRARPLMAKVREGTAALVTVGTRLPSPALTLTGRVVGFRGIGRGSGRITSVVLDVRAETKTRRDRATTLYLGEQSTLRAV